MFTNHTLFTLVTFLTGKSFSYIFTTGNLLYYQFNGSLINRSRLILLAGDIETNPGPTINSLRVLQINARSLKTVDQNKNKLVQFKSLMALKKPHVVSICETWLNSTVKNKDLLSSKRYKIYRKDRDVKKGGGVMVAVTTSIRSKRRKDIEARSNTHNEMIVVEIKQRNGTKLGLVSLYRPPDDLNYLFSDNFKHIISNLWDKGILEILVLGDLNFPEIRWDTGYPPNTEGLMYTVADTLQDYGFVQLNTYPSRLENDNILDVVLSNHPHKVSKLKCYRDIISTDHAILDFNYTIKPARVDTRPREVFNFQRTNFEALREEYRNSDWARISEDMDIDEMVNSWNVILLDVANRIIPKTKVREANAAPWIDGETINLSNKKETKRRKAKRTGRARHWQTYKEYNQRLQLMIHRKFNEYVAEV